MRELRFHLGGSSPLVMRKLQGTFAEPYISVTSDFGLCDILKGLGAAPGELCVSHSRHVNFCSRD